MVHYSRRIDLARFVGPAGHQSEIAYMVSSRGSLVSSHPLRDAFPVTPALLAAGKAQG